MHAETVYPRGVHKISAGYVPGRHHCVTSKRGTSEHVEVGIGLHQGSALSPFRSIMLVDTISQDVRNELPWELLYADDLAIIDVTSTDTQNRLESWQKVLTDNGLKINVAKTEHLSTRENPLPIELNGEELKNVDHFKYLGSVIDKDAGFVGFCQDKIQGHSSTFQGLNLRIQGLFNDHPR